MNAACRILSTQERSIDLLCVVPETRADSEKLCHRATRILDRARHMLSEQGISAQPVIKRGSPIKALLRESLQYDVTVVGARRQDDDSPAALGPVANRIVEHSSASVLIGREPRTDPGLRILAPIDGSDAAFDAVEKLATLVDLSTADITLMHVVETPWLSSPDQELLEEEAAATDPQTQLTQEFERELEREGESVIEEARNRLPPRTTVSRVIERGLPAETILTEAESGDYDLVLVAASGATDMKHQLLGSVSMKIAWNAPCSVLLVRHEA